MIFLRNLSLRYGKNLLYNDISAAIHAHDRIGLVGSNGSGKSTFLKVLMGETETDSGTIEKPDYFTVGYLPQDGIQSGGKTLFDEAQSAFGDALELQKKIDAAGDQMATMDTSTEAFYDLVDQMELWEKQLEEHEPRKMRSRIERILLGLGFSLEDLERNTAEFSGGWQMRIALAKLLLQAPSLLLLDEPTNHLDIVTQTWVEDYLKHYQGALVVISHDRAFLDEVTTRTMELKLGRLATYKGNYSFYEKEREARRVQNKRAYDNQKKEIGRMKDFINRFRSNVKKASLVQSRIKALEKMELITLEPEEKKMYFRFPPPPPGSARVITLENMHKSFGDLHLFQGLDLRIEPGDRIAVVGVNGAGKSTLARILAGVEPIDQGERQVGINTVIGYFAQQQAEELNPRLTVQQEVEQAVEDPAEANPRAVLGALLFSGEDANKKVEVLSGGERNRVALAKMLMRPANCIILDEPTNHLDLRSKEVLQDAINTFDGSVILVSHDRAFLDGVVNKVLEVSPSGTRMLTCNVTEYIQRLEAERAARENGDG
ncbi:MAG: ATP-binding cassette domain-containing protein [Opitutales bacterium]|nr:ATP-binding cassette domain-containing protein [Opitutales bacterium]